MQTPDAPGHMLHTAHEIGQEIGVTIGETMAAHLPNPQAAAQRRGLDIRWMRLKYNIPGILIATLVTWGDNSLAEAMARSLAEGGPLALLGWPLMAFLVLGLVMVTPLGGALGGVLMEAIRAVLQGLGRLIGRFWRVQYTGYLLRLIVAVVAWSVAIALLRLIGRAVILFLTGA
ncbi:hypothetical protein B7755_052100 [Streptomyces sp. NBS 14/10]|uniref:hypothetical protein n=1 Tax=Streptomyces sp. NBS 14/10 TaxID=1945643 RepID=UPI00117E9ACC|nr:hypothetical protein [Streptomyces sp. NBS 14/10]KAK1176692.1 hypothetical protein B7755_052100 [Streptomyces sp. NBS 14/10]